jgi:hypothetical protein
VTIAFDLIFKSFNIGMVVTMEFAFLRGICVSQTYLVKKYFTSNISMVEIVS